MKASQVLQGAIALILATLCVGSVHAGLSYDLTNTSANGWLNGNNLGLAAYNSSTVFIASSQSHAGYYNASANNSVNVTTTLVGLAQTMNAVGAISPENVFFAGAASNGFYYNYTNNASANAAYYFTVMSGQSVTALSAVNMTAVYFGGGSGRYGMYNKNKDSVISLTTTDPGDWIGTSNILGMESFNSTALYIAISAGKFGLYNYATNSTADLSSTDVGDWINNTNIQSVSTLDATRTYIGGATGKFGVYNYNTNSTADLSGTDVGDWFGTATITSLHAFNSTAVYMSLTNGKFGVYNPSTNVTYDLSGTDVANWFGGTGITLNRVLAVNSTHVYIGGNGRFGFYDSSNFSNLKLTLKDFNTGSSINTFNATINGVAYTTTNGTIETSYTNLLNTFNITNVAANFYTTINFTNLNVTVFNYNINLSALVNITARDLYTNSSLLTWNLTIDNATSYSTSTGTVVTTIPRNDTSKHDFNISPNFYVPYNFTQINVSSGWFNSSISPLVNLTDTDYYTHLPLSYFNSRVDDSYNFTTWTFPVTGKNTTVTAIPRNDTSLHNFTFTEVASTGNASQSFLINYTNVNVSSGWVNATTYRSVMNFNVTEAVSGSVLAGYTVSILNQSNYSAATPYLIGPVCGVGTECNVTFNRTGWFNHVDQFAVARVTNYTYNISNVSQYLLNVSARNATGGANLTSFTVYVTNSLYGYYAVFSTTNGTIIIPVANGTYNVSLNTTGISTGVSILMNASGTGPTVFNGSIGFYSTNSVEFHLRDVTTGNLLNVSAQIVLTGATITYNYSTSNGTYLATGLNTDTYVITLSATGYVTNQVLLTTSGGFYNVTYYMSSSTQPISFQVIDALGNPGDNITVSFGQNINGTVVTFAQVITDFSGLFNVNLNPNVTYTMTAFDPGGTYTTFTGLIKPDPAFDPYLITLQYANTGNGSGALSGVYTAYNALYNNTTKTINITWEVSCAGCLSWFSMNTTYNGTTYTNNVSGIPGGGIANITIPGVNLTVQNQINVSFYFVRTGFPQYSITVPFLFIDAAQGTSAGNSSLTGGLFTPPTSPATGLGRAILGMIILVLVTAGTFKFTGLLPVTAFVGIVTIGVLATPAIALFPVLPSIIAVAVGMMILISSEVGRR